MTELRALTSARGLAAWLVVLYHIRLSIDGLPASWLAALARCYVAVDFFFLLSGLVIWLSWNDRIRDHGLAAVPTFLRKRVARIWPLHLFVLGCAVLLALTLAATGRHDPREFPLPELPLHIVLVQNWGFTQALSWNDPAWSISCELAAYLLFPVLALTIDWRRVPTCAVLAALAAMFVLLAAVFAASGAQRLGEDITHLGLVRCLIEFSAGTGIGALWLRWSRNADEVGRTGRVAAERHVMLAFLTSGAGFVLWWLGLPEALALPPAFAALLLGLALTSGRRGNPLEGRILHTLGEASYATYLGHFLLFVVFKLVFVEDASAVPPVLIALYLVLVLISSVVLYHGVERPAQRWINAWGERRRGRRGPAAALRSSATS